MEWAIEFQSLVGRLGTVGSTRIVRGVCGFNPS